MPTDEIDNSSDDRKREIMKNNTFEIAQKAKSSDLHKEFANNALKQMADLFGDEGTTDQEGESKEVYQDLSDIHERFLEESKVIDEINNTDVGGLAKDRTDAVREVLRSDSRMKEIHGNYLVKKIEGVSQSLSGEHKSSAESALAEMKKEVGKGSEMDTERLKEIHDNCMESIPSSSGEASQNNGENKH